jgi:hypothetical protein
VCDWGRVGRFGERVPVGFTRKHAGAAKTTSSFSSSAMVWGRGGLLLALRGEWRWTYLVGFPAVGCSPLSIPPTLSSSHSLSPTLSFPHPQHHEASLRCSQTDRSIGSHGIRMGVGGTSQVCSHGGSVGPVVGMTMATLILFEVGPCCGGPCCEE